MSIDFPVKIIATPKKAYAPEYMRVRNANVALTKITCEFYSPCQVILIDLEINT